MALDAGVALGWRRGAPLVFLLATVAAAVAFAANVALAEVRAGNPWSLAYGTAAMALLLLAAAYGLRRRMMRVASRYRAGRAAGWLALHVWGGALFLLLMLMHSGFRLPSGVITGWLWALSWWTVATGIAGRMLQRWIPRVLASGLTTEAIYERIPELVEDLAGRAARVAAGGGHEAVADLYRRRLEPHLARPRRRWQYFIDVGAGRERLRREFRHLRRLLEDQDRRRLDELEGLYRTKLELDAHYTLQRALRVWLVLHVPPAVLLVALLVAHLYAVWGY